MVRLHIGSIVLSFLLVAFYYFLLLLGYGYMYRKHTHHLPLICIPMDSSFCFRRLIRTIRFVRASSSLHCPFRFSRFAKCLSHFGSHWLGVVWRSDGAPSMSWAASVPDRMFLLLLYPARFGSLCFLLLRCSVVLICKLCLCVLWLFLPPVCCHVLFPGVSFDCPFHFQIYVVSPFCVTFVLFPGCSMCFSVIAAMRVLCCSWLFLGLNFSLAHSWYSCVMSVVSCCSCAVPSFLARSCRICVTFLLSWLYQIFCLSYLC